jgi:ABC-type dipeptide/oligopeptide/nickel transport system permease component
MTTSLTLGCWLAGVIALFAAAAATRFRAPFLSFLMRRSAWVVVTLVLVFTVTFALMRTVPGGPFDSEVASDPQIKENLIRQYGLDRAPLVQWADTLGQVLRGDLGPSLKMRDFSVNEVLGQGLPRSALLGLVALLLALLAGIPAGVLAAARRGTADRAIMAVAVLGLALPNFILAALLLIPFSFGLGWLPAAGSGSARHLVLPAVALAAPIAATIARLVRTGMIDQLSRDFVRTARAKGLSPARVLFVHALPPALLPVVAYLAPAAAAVLTGSLVIEAIFAIPGMGSHFVQAALSRDYPLAMGAVLLYTLIVSTLNVAVDGLLTVLDPRVKLT